LPPTRIFISSTLQGIQEKECDLPPTRIFISSTFQGIQGRDSAIHPETNGS